MTIGGVIYIDVDGTLISEDGTDRLFPAMKKLLPLLKNCGYTMYLWSMGGAEYAKSVARKHKVMKYFKAFLSKPDIVVDDHFESFAHWKPLKSGDDAKAEDILHYFIQIHAKEKND